MAAGVATPARTVVSGLVPHWLWSLGLVAALLTAAQSFSVSYMGSGWSAPRGTTGFNALTECDPDRFCAVALVRPGSPAEHAGIVAGDRLRLDRYWERRRTLSPGDHVGATVRHDGRERHVDLVAAPRLFYAPTFIVSGLANAAACLIALLILARAGRRWASFLLGCALVSLNVPGGYPRFGQNEPALYPWFFFGLSVAYMSGPVLMLAALREFRRDLTGHAPRWLDRLLWTTGLIVLVATVVSAAVNFNGAPLLGITDDLLPTSLAWSVGSLLGPLALAAGWHDVPSANRTRYAFLWAAVSVTSIHPIVDPIIIAAGNNYVAASWPVVIQLVSMILGAALFAYAILRHRVVDLGFAINRTLVYSALSFLTLAIFGLVEWASERLLPFESHEASVVIEAGVALTLFLVFHRIHAWIEGSVERIFFHRWHTNEALLRRFLHQASHITRAEVLIERSIAELRRFSGGAPVTLYRLAEQSYEHAAGDAGAAPLIDTDAPALVTMRADRNVVRDAFAGGDLALPMMLRGAVTGFIVLGPKPAGDPYRADEETLLSEAVNRIGLDLYAFRVDELQKVNGQLSLRLKGMAKTGAMAVNQS